MLNLTLTGRPRGALRILCLGAHCDDIEIGCGGTLLSLLEQQANAVVHWVVFSSTQERAAEAQICADAFLKRAMEREIVVMQYRDGFFPYTGGQIKDEFEKMKRTFDPDLIFTHYRDDRHQDHRLISDLAWNTYRNHMVLEYEIPKYDGDLGSPNFFVPLEESICASKIHHIIDSFPSQVKKQWFDEETFMSMLRIRGMEANSPTRYAEAFYCRKAVLGFSTVEK
jgi:LmbE family N-acetylglucosaminyl deacetylase